MRIDEITVGPVETRCYILSREDGDRCIVIDPGDEAARVRKAAGGKTIEAILLTHGHFDHVGALRAVQEETGAAVYMNRRDDARFSTDEHMRFIMEQDDHNYDEGDVVEAAGLRFFVMATPGHTPGGVTLRCEDALFTGDTLFKGSCGRTDLPGGDMEQELRSIRRICELPGDYEVYPGHMDSTTLERERNFNYYCRMALRG